METHADQLFFQKSQPPGKHQNLHFILQPLGLLVPVMTLEINPYRMGCVALRGECTCITYLSLIHALVI